MKTLLVSWLLAAVVAVNAQPFQLVKSITLPYTADFATIDRVGDIYVLSHNGDIQKINAAGIVEATAKLPAAPTLFDPRDGSHLFLYWRSTQRYGFLLPNLEMTRPEVQIDSALALSPYLMAPSGERDFLVLDSADWSLKKINGRTNTVSYETIIHDNETTLPSFIGLREYQNFIFLLDQKKGILIFNMMGKLLKTIGPAHLNTFGSLGEEIYFLSGDTLHFYDLFTAETRTVKLPVVATFAFLTDERLYLIQGDTVQIYSIK
jgi:hypothetical protein